MMGHNLAEGTVSCAMKEGAMGSGLSCLCWGSSSFGSVVSYRSGFRFFLSSGLIRSLTLGIAAYPVYIGYSALWPFDAQLIPVFRAAFLASLGHLESFRLKKDWS